MKGLLFSSDYVKDKDGGLRLLEVNTDTGIIPAALENFDFTEICNVISESNISEVHIVYKYIIHDQFVTNFSQSISENVPSVTEFVRYEEGVNSVYPEQPNDSDDRFILRLAYDEAAIFDSIYAKDRFELYKLYIEGGESDKVTQYFYSSSDDYINTLDYHINDGVIPDVAIKDRYIIQNPVDFYKIGKTSDIESDSERWNNFLSQSMDDTTIVEQYHFDPSSSLVDNHMTSIRNFSILYGDNLDLVELYTYKIKSIFDLPNSVDEEIIDNQYINKLGDQHYFEYTTNHFKGNNKGIVENERILMSGSFYKEIKDIEVGDILTSYYIGGAPDYNPNESESIEWSPDGGMPSGSYITSSVVMLKVSQQLQYGSLFEIIVDDDSILCASGKVFLVYESGSDTTKYKSAFELNPDNHYLYDFNGNIIDIDEVNFYVTTETDTSLVELDVEDTDTYIISGSTSFNSVITHNSPCFVAGTKIDTTDGIKNIEDVKVGDYVQSYNHISNHNEYQMVSSLTTKLKEETIKIYFNDTNILHCTHDHPVFSLEKGYVSFNPKKSKELYNMDIEQLECGMRILSDDGSSMEVTEIKIGGRETVYNLHGVVGNHNFFANGLLVHNRIGPGYCFISGTTVITRLGSKPIEEIKIGDDVLSFNEETKKQEYKKVIDTKQPIHCDLVTYHIGDDITLTSTWDHPLYINDYVLASYAPVLTNNRYELPSQVRQIQCGDVVHTSWEEIEGIKEIEQLSFDPTQTYIITVEDNHNFYANGILVHNK